MGTKYHKVGRILHSAGLYTNIRLYICNWYSGNVSVYFHRSKMKEIICNWELKMLYLIVFLLQLKNSARVPHRFLTYSAGFSGHCIRKKMLYVVWSVKKYFSYRAASIDRYYLVNDGHIKWNVHFYVLKIQGINIADWLFLLYNSC